MQFDYIPQGTCSRQISFNLDGEKITDIKFTGGCSGNLKGICALANGQSATKLITALRGLQCGNKGTSCPDQLARAIEHALDTQNHATPND